MKQVVRQGSKLGKKLDKIAESIADSMTGGDTPDPDRINAFRSLCAYMTMINKLPPDEEEDSFNGFKNSLATLGGGKRRRGPAVPTGPGTITLSADEDEFSTE